MDDFLNYSTLNNDSVGKEFLTRSNHSSFDFATISTMTSLQGLDTSLLHDRFTPILGLDSKTPKSIEKTNSNVNNAKKEKTNYLKEDDKFIKSCTNIAKLKNTTTDAFGISEKDASIESSPLLENGIRTLYTISSNSSGTYYSIPLPLSITKIKVNGLEIKVIPSLKLSPDITNKEVPSGFKNSDHLVEYYLGKVLRSSNSLFYIEKKLQQALYGAVFLAFELEECKKDERVEKKEVSHNSTSGSSMSLQHYNSSSFKFDPIKNRVAIKISSMSLKRRKPSLKENMKAEVTYSDDMRGHKNVLEYSEIWQDSFKNIYVKMEYAEFEDLFEVMRRRRRPLTENEARWLFSQIFNAVISLHENNIAMRDLSLENILMFSKEPHFFDISQDPEIVGIIRPGDSIIVPKITDPGQACRIFPKEKDEVSNIWKVYQRHPRDSGFQLEKVDFLFGKSFRPPEAYETGSLYDPTKVDVFCLGWMLLFTLTKYQPFETCRLITDNQNHNQLKNEGFINSLFGKLVPGNNKDEKITKVNGKSYICKDQNWSLIVNGRISDLFKKIKATNLSYEAQDLIKNMLLPDFKERFSMQNVIKHPWLNISSNNHSKYFTPLMASTLSPIRSRKTMIKQEKQSSNIVNPSTFFDNLEPKNNSTINNNNIKTTFDECKLQDSARSQANILISKVNNDYLCSMVKRTNDRLNMTRVNLARRKDSDIDSLVGDLNSSNISDSRQINPILPDSELINQKLANPLIKLLKNKRNGQSMINNNSLPSSSSSSSSFSLSTPERLIQVNKPSNLSPNTCQKTIDKKKNTESNFILDLWSFFSNGGGGNVNTHEHIILN